MSFTETKPVPILEKLENTKPHRFTLFKYVGAFGICLLMVACYYFFYGSSNGSLGIVMLFLGAIGFLPVGLLIGWAMTDKFALAKFKRMTTKKNYGVIQLVENNNKNIVPFIKNFSGDTIEWIDRCWRMDKDRIYNEKDDIEHKIEAKHIKYQSGVPTLFLNMDTFAPMDFWQPATPINPRMLFATFKAWLITKEAELLNKKMKILNLLLFGAIICAVAAATFAYMTYDMVKTTVMPKTISTDTKIDTLTTMVSQINSGNSGGIPLVNGGGTVG